MEDVIACLAKERQVGDVFRPPLLCGGERTICHGLYNELMESNALSQRMHLWQGTGGSALNFTTS